VRLVDTNILLYAVSRAPAEAAKARVARTLLDGTDVALSVQVLQEFYVQATRATRRDALTHEQAVGLIEAWRRFPVQDTTVEVLTAALETTKEYRIAFWDAAIIEAARAIGCDTVISEDLSHRRDFGGVRVENPF
jgi:predicted nucleic acid-binding protein